jgi:ubiquitin C-terminal hydrolase
MHLGQWLSSLRLSRIYAAYDDCVIEPSHFYEILQCCTDRFDRGVQEDAHEFLSYLLDSIHEDLNRVKFGDEIVMPEKLKTIHETVSEAEVTSKAAWRNHLLKNKSIIVDLFQGQVKSTLACQACKLEYDSFDPVMYWSLPFPQDGMNENKVFTLEELLREYSKVEKLDDKVECEKCNQKEYFTKKLDFWKAPNILILHLKRFTFSQNQARKINNLVTFKTDEIEISEFTPGYQKEDPRYKLFAVVVYL